jgi:cell division protein FtsW
MTVNHPIRTEKTAGTPPEAVTVPRPQPFSFEFDIYLVLVVAGLLALGLMMVFSTTFDWSYQVFGSPTRIFLRQVRSLGVGAVVMVVLARLDYHLTRRMAVPIILVAVVTLVVLLTLPNTEAFGARRSFFNGSIQPGEAAKLAVIIYLAAWLAGRGRNIKKLTYGLLPFSVLVGVVCGLVVLQPDLSTALIIFLTAWAMFFLAGAAILQLLISAIIASGVGFLLTLNFAYARERLALHWRAASDLTTASWHVQQAVIAFTAPGRDPLNPFKPNWFGVGLGQSSQKFGFLPAPHTDSIFAIIGEELGLLGTLIVVVLYVIFVWRGISISREAADSYGALLASGITLWVAVEALLNVAVMTAVLPFSGVPLPFISYGGSSLVTLLAAVGLLLSISRSKDYQAPRRTRADYTVGRRDRRGRVSRVGRGRSA